MFNDDLASGGNNQYPGASSEDIWAKKVFCFLYHVSRMFLHTKDKQR